MQKIKPFIMADRKLVNGNDVSVKISVLQKQKMIFKQVLGPPYYGKKTTLVIFIDFRTICSY